MVKRGCAIEDKRYNGTGCEEQIAIPGKINRQGIIYKRIHAIKKIRTPLPIVTFLEFSILVTKSLLLLNAVTSFMDESLGIILILINSWTKFSLYQKVFSSIDCSFTFRVLLRCFVLDRLERIHYWERDKKQTKQTKKFLDVKIYFFYIKDLIFHAIKN